LATRGNEVIGRIAHAETNYHHLVAAVKTLPILVATFLIFSAVATDERRIFAQLLPSFTPLINVFMILCPLGDM